MKITLDVEIDKAAWAREYGLSAEEIGTDIESYVAGIRESIDLGPLITVKAARVGR